MSTLLRDVIVSQFEASLAMLRECIAKCPAEHWDAPIAKYPFWQVAYHTLCFVDFYLWPNEHTWQPRTEPGGFHPAGKAELEWEYPSRRFTQDELLAYTDLCHNLLTERLAGESPEMLAGPCGQDRRPFSRAELHLYNMRHVQHHAGQLSASLRRVGVDTRWIGAGWR